MPTLREELEAIASTLEDSLAHATLAARLQWGYKLRELAARCEPEKPGEALALPDALEKAREALFAFAEPVVAEVQDHELCERRHTAGALRRAYAALSAIEAWRPEPQSEVVQATTEKLRAWAAKSHVFLFDSGDKAVASLLADRLASAVPEKREALPEAIRETVGWLRETASEGCPAPGKEEVLDIAARLESAAVPAAPDEGACARALRRLSDAVAERYAGDYSFVESIGGAMDAAALVLDRVAHADGGEGAGQEADTGDGDSWMSDGDGWAEVSRPAPPAPAPSAAGEGEVTLSPTEEFFSVNGAPTRAWRGTDGGGRHVTAYVAGVLVEKSLDNLTTLGLGELEVHRLDGNPYARPQEETPPDNMRCAEHDAPLEYVPGPPSEEGDWRCPQCEPDPDPCDPQAFVAAMEEAIRRIAGEAARAELSKWALDRRGDEPSIFTASDWRNLYAGLALAQLATLTDSEWPDSSRVARCWQLADMLAAPLLAAIAPKPDPAPEEHVAPDTSSTRRKP